MRVPPTFKAEIARLAAAEGVTMAEILRRLLPNAPPLTTAPTPTPTDTRPA